MNVKVTVDDSGINVKATSDKIMNDRAFGIFAATQWHKLYYDYVPQQERVLANTVKIEPWAIEHTAPYARYQYEGHFSHKNSKNPDKASRQWDKAAAPTQGPKLVSSLQAYIDSGKLKLD